ncbi:MAG: polyprenyl synthetase family protein [Omnitrophica bacterium]|nr:polyprenyl synthetase family protein [Candidatus Omnitrophota bacterium]
MRELKEIYRPIEKDLREINNLIGASFGKSENRSIAYMGKFLLDSPGKRIRPALAILSARAIRPSVSSAQLIKIASAVELIHMASLVHDDVIDHSPTRHNKPTVNSKWGKDVAIALGDYLYSVAFELVSECDNFDIVHCISLATKAMCEGELIQVCERDNLNLLKNRYIVIVKKKTASLFAASCQTGALVSEGYGHYNNALKEYGLNFGIAFQIVDDYLDLVEEKDRLGKNPGQDIGVGETTLPVLNLLQSIPVDKRKYLKKLLASRKNKNALKEIKLMLFDSGAALRTKEQASSYATLARKKLDVLPDSIFKQSLSELTEFIMQRGWGRARRVAS